MCGILGIAGASGVPVPREVVERMRDAIAHRGPDDAGLYEDAHVKLAHRRLSIIDIGGGHQPMSNDDHTVHLIHNGEIYNFLDVRRDLEAYGLVFRTRSDTEVILRAYEKWGTRCVEKLHGIFAFAVWDAPRKRLLLARDRLGIKPLYYCASRDTIRFASEMKAFLEDPAFDRAVDAAAVDMYFAYGYIPAPHTIFRSVKKVLPAHILVWQNGTFHTERYWRFEPRPEDGAKKESEWLDEFRDVLRGAVSRQMVSDVPLGAFLSGGIDSSLIVRMMSETSSTPVKTFTIGFGADKTSETPYAKTVAELFQTEHHEFQVTPDKMEEILPLLVRHTDEPFADASIIPTYYVSKITREKVTVALSGDGGDELFAGYTRHQGEKLTEQFRRLPPGVRSRIERVLGADALQRVGRVRRLRHVLANAELGFVSRYRNKEMLSQDLDRRRLYSEAFRTAGKTNGDPVNAIFEELARYTKDLDAIGRLTVFDLEFYLPNDMLMKVDKMSMASALEVRVPFLDETVVEAASRIPTRLKLKGYTTKYLLRRLAAEVLPPEIFKRRKQGFGVPLQTWFRGELTGYAREMLIDNRTLSRGYFDREALESVLDDHEERRGDHSRMIFALIAFELWNRAFVDRRGS